MSGRGLDRRMADVKAGILSADGPACPVPVGDYFETGFRPTATIVMAVVSAWQVALPARIARAPGWAVRVNEHLEAALKEIPASEWAGVAAGFQESADKRRSAPVEAAIAKGTGA